MIIDYLYKNIDYFYFFKMMSILGFFDQWKEEGKFYDLSSMRGHANKGLITIFSDTIDSQFVQDLYEGPYLHGFIMMDGKYEFDNYKGKFLPNICNDIDAIQCSAELQNIINQYISGCEYGTCNTNQDTSHWYEIYRNYDIRPYDNPNENDN